MNSRSAAAGHHFDLSCSLPHHVIAEGKLSNVGFNGIGECTQMKSISRGRGFNRFAVTWSFQVFLLNRTVATTNKHDQLQEADRI